MRRARPHTSGWFRRPAVRAGAAGMTVLELMIVLAIIAGASLLVRSGFRMITKADLVENSTELCRGAAAREPARDRARRAAPRRARSRQAACTPSRSARAPRAIQRNEKLRADRGRDQARAREAASSGSRAAGRGVRGGRPRRGHEARARDRRPPHRRPHVRAPRATPITGAAERRTATGEGLGARAALRRRGSSSRRSGSSTATRARPRARLAIYFFPIGGRGEGRDRADRRQRDVHVLVYGLTGRVELKDGELQDVNDHMLRNVMGDRNTKREAAMVTRASDRRGAQRTAAASRCSRSCSALALLGLRADRADQEHRRQHLQRASRRT